MTKEYNDSLNRGLVTFILKSIAVILAVAGILCINGTIKFGTSESSHTKEVYVDGILTEKTEWNELENIQAKLNIHINVDEETTLWSK